MATWQLKLLFDGACPICRRNVDWLKARDHTNALATEDIAIECFEPERYGLSREAVQQAMHGILPNGRIVRGMEAVRAAYRTVGLGWLIAPTALPGIRQAADVGYRLFARHRGAISHLFGWGCPGGSCGLRR